MNTILEIIKHRSFKITILLTLIYFGIGFAFLHFGLADYGWVFFVLLPFSLGIAVGKMERKKWGFLGLLIGVLIFLTLLIAGGLEGFVCVIMAIPIIVPLIWLGTLANKYLTKKGIIKSKNHLNVMILPLLITLFGAPIEKYFIDNSSDIIEVKTEKVYPYSPEQVYHTIKSVDTLIAKKPFLMKLDLPIPQKCVLETEEVGGIRTCYFSGGTITERITQLEVGKVLKMDVIDYQLTGRNWLGFNEAIYYFEEVEESKCKLTRITTYTSKLKPRFYWEPLEKIGIIQEHNYVFENLNNDLKKKYDR
ncbi:SRPBCC family protein [Aureispira anguillae]|uniref:Polyketide cyclase n=1 Tax=Aureispira anguillae TaxID=2864201 RepID=A0A916DUS8_9BACT|nr:hypothetical protein [Aureispira anguillae]BDS12790.1 hypothetical protein AsAng_0035150 [Aureispira anguillae]